MALIEQLEYGTLVGAVCAAQLLPCGTGRARPAAPNITYGIFNLCVHSFFILFSHLVSITYTHTGDPVWLTEH